MYVQSLLFSLHTRTHTLLLHMYTSPYVTGVGTTHVCCLEWHISVNVIHLFGQVRHPVVTESHGASCRRTSEGFWMCPYISQRITGKSTWIRGWSNLIIPCKYKIYKIIHTNAFGTKENLKPILLFGFIKGLGVVHTQNYKKIHKTKSVLRQDFPWQLTTNNVFKCICCIALQLLELQWLHLLRISVFRITEN